MNSSFSVDDDDDGSSIFDDDFGDDFDDDDDRDGATGSVSSCSSVVLVLPEDGVSMDDSEGERTTDQYVPFVVGNVPLYLAAGDDGKPIYIRQCPQSSEEMSANNSGHDLSFGGFSDDSGSTFEGFGSTMFEGFMEDGDSDESQFDGFSGDSAEVVEGKQKIEYIRKWQKMSQSYNNLDLESFLEDSNNSFTEAQPSTSKGSRKKSKVAPSSFNTHSGKRKRLHSPVKQGQEFMRRSSVGNDDTSSGGNALVEGKRKYRRTLMTPKIKPKTLKPQPDKGSVVKSKREKTEMVYLVPDVDVKEEIEIKEEEQEVDNNEFIGVHCNQVGCTISWLESMTTKLVTVTNGIVFELDEFAKRINWEKIHVAKWILRLRGILDIEPTEEDMLKIHTVLKRRKALTVTLAGNKKGYLKLQEFDTSDFTLPSDIKREIDQVIMPKAVNVGNDSPIGVKVDGFSMRATNTSRSRGAQSSLVMPEKVGSGRYCQVTRHINEDVYEEGEIRKSGRALKPSSRVKDRDGDPAPYGVIKSSLVLTMRGVSENRRQSLPNVNDMGMASEDAKKSPHVGNNVKKRRVSEDSHLMSTKASTASDAGSRTRVSNAGQDRGEVQDDGSKRLKKARDPRVSYYCRNNQVYPYFKETAECLGKYCSAAGLTIDDLNSFCKKDIHVTQGLVVELFHFYRGRGCTITALAQRLLQLKELNSVNLVSMIVKISNLMKKGRKDKDFLDAEFIFPRSKKEGESSSEKFQAPGWEIKIKQGTPTHSSEMRRSRRHSIEKSADGNVGIDTVVNKKNADRNASGKTSLEADAGKQKILNDCGQRKLMRRSSRLSLEESPGDAAVIADNDTIKIDEKRTLGIDITSDGQRSIRSSTENCKEKLDTSMDKHMKVTDVKSGKIKSDCEKQTRKLSFYGVRRKSGTEKNHSTGEKTQEEKKREKDDVLKGQEIEEKSEDHKSKEGNDKNNDELKVKETSENVSRKGCSGDLGKSKETSLDKEVSDDRMRKGDKDKCKAQSSGEDAHWEIGSDLESVDSCSDVNGGGGLASDSDEEDCEVGSTNMNTKDGNVKDSSLRNNQTEGTSNFDVLIGKGILIEQKSECTTQKPFGKKNENMKLDDDDDEEEIVKGKSDVKRNSDADVKEREEFEVPEDRWSSKDDDDTGTKEIKGKVYSSSIEGEIEDGMERNKKLCNVDEKDKNLITGQEKGENLDMKAKSKGKGNDTQTRNLHMELSNESDKEKMGEIRRSDRERTLSKRVQEFHSVSEFFEEDIPELKHIEKSPKSPRSTQETWTKPLPFRKGNGMARQFLTREDPRVQFSFIDGRIIPYFKERDFYLGDYCRSVGLTIDDLNSRDSRDIFLTKGAVVELVNFYRSRGCTMTSLADRLLRMKKIYLDSILNLVARFAPIMKYEGNKKKMMEEFTFPPGEVNVMKRTPNRKNPKTKNKEGGGPVKSTNSKSQKVSTYTCEVVFADGKTKTKKKKKKKKKEHPDSDGTDASRNVIGVKKLSDMKKKKKEHPDTDGTDASRNVIGVKKLGDMKKKSNEKNTGAVVDKESDQFIIDKEVEKARGKEGSVTRADIVLLYAKWLKNKNKIGSSVFVTDLLQDVVKLMEERKVQTIRIPAGTLMSSSVKLYEEYRRMWNTSKADAMMYLEEDWLEDIQYLVSITQTSRRNTVESNEGGDGNGPNADESKASLLVHGAAKRPLHDEGNFSDSGSERSLRIDESYVSDNSDLDDLPLTSRMSQVKKKENAKPKSKPAPAQKKKFSEAKNVRRKNSTTSSSANKKYEISKIVDYKCMLDKNSKKHISYLVRWKGCGSAKDTWLSEDELQCPKNFEQYWKGGTTSQKSHGVLKWQSFAPNPKLDEFNSSENIGDLPSDSRAPSAAALKCTSGDEVNDKENSPHNLTNSKSKTEKGYMTNGELLHLYDCWRQENQKLSSSRKCQSINIKAFTDRVEKAMLTHGIDTVYSDFLLQACFILTLIRKMLSSQEALREFLCKDCMPALESSRTNQENNRRNSGSAKIRILSTNFIKLKADLQEVREATSGRCLRVAVVEDEVEKLERAWDRAQGKSPFLNGALRQEIIKLGKNLTELKDEENVHLAKEFRLENPEKYRKTCSDILECGVPEKNVEAVMNSVLKVIGRFSDDVQECT